MTTEDCDRMIELALAGIRIPHKREEALVNLIHTLRLAANSQEEHIKFLEDIRKTLGKKAVKAKPPTTKENA